MAKPAKKPAPAQDVVEIVDVEQRSPEWFAARRGIPTASKFSVVMASGKDGGESVGRDKYMKLLAGEIISGQTAESFVSEAMERGNRVEPEAREWYGRTRLVDLTPIGFVKRQVSVPLGTDYAVGCSPDSQVGPKSGLEIKSMAPHLLIDVALKGASGFPTGHRAQIQGTMWVCGWDEMDLLLFYPGWPKPPVFRVGRDEGYIATLRDAVETFNYELHRLVQRVREGR